MRNIVNCWIISDSEYFNFIKQWKDNVNYRCNDRNNQHDFDEIVPDKKLPATKTKYTSKKENMVYRSIL